MIGRFIRPGRNHLSRIEQRIGQAVDPRAAISALLLAAFLLPGCGAKSKTPVAADRPSAEPQFVFAARPVQMSPLPCASAILIEPKSNNVLYEQNAHERRAPASIAKMTLELVVMQEIEAGKLALTDTITTSAWASKIGGSQVYLAEGETFPLSELMQAITIHSANDACTAVAEHVAGTTEGFVQLMNQAVEGLKLTDTHYVNVHGLDDEPGAGNYSTASDISQIGRELIRYPHILEWSSTIEAPFRNGEFLLQNTNKLLGHFPGLDGIKTGYTKKAGFCLCASAERNGLRLISVIMGAASNKFRFSDTARLLAAGFNSYVTVAACRRGEPVADDLPVPRGKPASIRPTAAHDLTVLVSRPDDRKLKKEFVPAKGLKAPLEAGAVIGSFRVSSGDQLLAEAPVVTPVAVEATGFGAWLHRRFSKG